MPISSHRKTDGEKKKSENAIADKKEKIDIPKDFIKTIKKLGLREEDAEVLYQTKIDWTAVYSENKIYCPETTCDFSTTIDNEKMTNHMVNVHKYGHYKCQDPYCNYIGYSQKNLNLHQKMHTRTNQAFFFKCPKPNCGSSFQRQHQLDRHMRIHNNELDMCDYCPFRYENRYHYKAHLKSHFGIADFECDQCDKRFGTITRLKIHHELHDGIIYCCLICNVYENRQSNTMYEHFKQKHSEIMKDRNRWEDVREFTKTK